MHTMRITMHSFLFLIHSSSKVSTRRVSGFCHPILPARQRIVRKMASDSSNANRSFTDHYSFDITSPSNDRIKYIRTLHKRKIRIAEGRILVEGCRLIIDALNSGVQCDFVLATPDMLRSESGVQLQTLLRDTDGSSPKISITTNECIQRACDTVSPQGVVASMHIPKQLLPDALQFALILDGVSDPGNMGTLIRSAAALGVDAVILTSNSVDLWSPKALRSSMGASFRVPCVMVDSWKAVKDTLNARCSSIHYYAADNKAKETHWEVDWSQPSALVIGSEANGLCDDALKDLLEGTISGIRIPMYKGVESLNAAAAGAVILGEAQRQRFLEK